MNYLCVPYIKSDSYGRLTVVHVLFTCASLEPLRSVGWAAATQFMPGPLADSLGSLCGNEKMIVLLSELNCPYVPEWQVIYQDIITGPLDHSARAPSLD